MRPALLLLSLGALLPLLPLSAGAVTIVLDYSYDTSNLFPVGGVARTTLAKAASDLSAVLGNTPLASMSTNSFMGTAAGSSATVDWTLSFTNPSNGTTVNLAAPQTTPGFAANEIRIYVGWQNMSGAVLGTATPGGASLTGGISSSNPSTLPTAIDNMEALSDAVMGRGDGPVIATLSGNYGSPGTDFTLDYGAFVGSLWFDSDMNNDGSTDSSGAIALAWNLGLGLPTSGQADLYSTALHEMMHAIGFGSSETWASLSDPRIAADHLASGTTSPRLSDGVSQEAVMTPSTSLGVRKELTAADLEFLGKLGYNVVPEPGIWALVAVAAGLMARRHRRLDA